MASFLKTPVRILKIGQITKLNNYVICNTQIHSLSALKTQTFSFVRNYQWVKALFEGKGILQLSCCGEYSFQSTAGVWTWPGGPSASRFFTKTNAWCRISRATRTPHERGSLRLHCSRMALLLQGFLRSRPLVLSVLLATSSCDNGPLRLLLPTYSLQLLPAEADRILLVRKTITGRSALP